MSLDITASKTWEYNNKFGFYDIKDEITGFTLSSRLNDYWGAYDLFKNNADEVIGDENNVYVYLNKTLIKLQEINKEKNFGEDVEVFLRECINSKLNKVYIKIF